MALPTGSGTETLHSHFFQDVDGGPQTLIFGVQHHVYTVISIIVYCNALNATTDFGYLDLKTYDNYAGSSGNTMRLARFNIQVGETYVWNDKFSFNGYEPSGTAVLSAAVQILNAAQGGSADAELQLTQTHSVDDFDVLVTYLDQDWS